MHQVEITERINDYFADSTIVGVGFVVAGLDSFCEEFVFSSASPSVWCHTRRVSEPLQLRAYGITPSQFVLEIVSIHLWHYLVDVSLLTAGLVSVRE